MSFLLFEFFSLFFLCLCLAVSVRKLPCRGFHVGHVIKNLLVFWYTHPFPRHFVMRACRLNQLFQNSRKHYTKTRLFQKASTSFHCNCLLAISDPLSTILVLYISHLGPRWAKTFPGLPNKKRWEFTSSWLHFGKQRPLIIFIPDMENLRFCRFQSTCPFQMGFQFSTLLVLSGLTCTVSVFGPFHMVHRWSKNKS